MCPRGGTTELEIWSLHSYTYVQPDLSSASLSVYAHAPVWDFVCTLPRVWLSHSSQRPPGSRQRWTTHRSWGSVGEASIGPRQRLRRGGGACSGGCAGRSSGRWEERAGVPINDDGVMPSHAPSPTSGHRYEDITTKIHACAQCNVLLVGILPSLLPSASPPPPSPLRSTTWVSTALTTTPVCHPLPATEHSRTSRG